MGYAKQTSVIRRTAHVAMICFLIPVFTGLYVRCCTDSAHTARHTFEVVFEAVFFQHFIPIFNLFGVLDADDAGDIHRRAI